VRTRFSFDSGVDWIASALGQPPVADSGVAEALVSEALLSGARAAE
jgi:hypothetical protein